MKKNVLITAVGGRSVGSGILHSLTRCNKEVRDRWNVISSDADSFAWGLYKTEKATLLPMASSDNYLENLKQVILKYHIDAIIPGSEPEVFVLSEKICELGVPVICNSYELMPLMRDKFKMADKLKELGLPFIETFPINEWELAIVKYDFPFIIKPTVGTGGSKGLNIVISIEDILKLLPTLDQKSNFCIQPYIGSGDDEYTVGVLSDKKGHIIDSIVMKRKLLGLSQLYSRKYKNSEYLVSSGYSQGFIIKDPDIQSYCENLALKIKSKGPLNIQLRKKDNEYYIFEIHPRFSGTTPIRADVGFNEVDIMLRCELFNETFGRLDYQYNVAAIRAFEHVIVPMDRML
jgi:carbamoyl-phosphate synthase large subunit